LISSPVSLSPRHGWPFPLIPEAELRETFWKEADDRWSGTANGQTVPLIALGWLRRRPCSADFALAGPALDKIRHEIKPELVYAYVASCRSDQVARFAEAVEEQNSVTAALTNTLMARMKGAKGTTSIWKYCVLSLSQAFDVNEAWRNEAGSARPRRPLGDLDMELDLKAGGESCLPCQGTGSISTRGGGKSQL